jgi:hypothetical protein
MKSRPYENLNYLIMKTYDAIQQEYKSDDVKKARAAYTNPEMWDKLVIQPYGDTNTYTLIPIIGGYKELVPSIYIAISICIVTVLLIIIIYIIILFQWSKHPDLPEKFYSGVDYIYRKGII